MGDFAGLHPRTQGLEKNLFRMVKQILGSQWESPKEEVPENVTTYLQKEDDDVVELIRQRTDIGPTERSQLVNARRGQGLYRKNLEALETKCRITGLRELQHLRASHIKPWRASSDFEKLDGNNGLLLSPHLDHLFDRGFISFKTDGTLLFSPSLEESVLSAWHIGTGLNCGAFRPEQRLYVEFHREYVFRRNG